MKPIRIITLALVFALCAFSAPPAHAQIGTTCTITGTVYQVDGVTPAAGATLTVTRADKAGKLYANTSRVYSTNSNGIVSFKVPRTVGTDTAVIHVKASFGNLASGQILFVPTDSTATLESLVRYTANPTFVVVAVPAGGGSGDTSLNGHPRLTRIENVEGQFTAGTSDSIQQTAASVYVARNVAEGKADADSVKLAFDRLGDRADADSLAGVKTTADGAVQKADTTALHAQKFAVINDSLFAISLRATTTKNDLTAHASTADAHLPSQTGASGKFLQSNGTVSSWQSAVTTETDPTAIPRTDSTRFVSRTAPQIPGLASADTNTVIGVDASGNLVLRKDDAGGSGGLTNWVETDTSAIQASRTLKPKAYTANVNAVIRPLGTGAFILGPPPDGTNTGGNARGAYAADFQMLRNSANQVALQNYSAIIGSVRSRIEGTLLGSFIAGSDFGYIAEGAACAIIGSSSSTIDAGQRYNNVILGGSVNKIISTATGASTVIGGFYGVANDTGAVVMGSYNDSTFYNVQYRKALQIGNGTGAADRRNVYEIRTNGDRVGGEIGRIDGDMVIHLRDTTLTAVPDTLTRWLPDAPPPVIRWDAGYRNLARFARLDSGQVWTFSALVAARSDAGDAGSYKVEGGIQRVGATTSLVGTPTVTTLGETAGAAGWDVAAVADDTLDALHIIVTGGANQRVRWHATLTISNTGW